MSNLEQLLKQLPSPQRKKLNKDARIEISRMHLLDFIQYCDPSYEVNWHHRVVCEYYERWAFGDINRMMLSMPPQNGKSTIVSGYGPAWVLGKNPNAKFVSASYSKELAETLNNKDRKSVV
jgi:hypothetical protein